MDLNNKLLSLTMRTSKTEKISEELVPKTILLNEENSIISSDSQPNNGTLYTAGYGCSSISLPSATGFNNHGFRIIIHNNTNTININMNSEYSHDVVTFNGSTYVTPSFFTLTGRGFVEMVWSYGGWIVLGSYGLSVTVNE